MINSLVDNPLISYSVLLENTQIIHKNSMFIQTRYGDSASDSNSISGSTRAWPCRPLHQLLGTVCVLQTADRTVIAVKHLRDQQKPRHSKADHKKTNTDKGWLIKRFLLPHILCLPEHTTKTAVTVSSWTTCATPTLLWKSRQNKLFSCHCESD